MSETEKIFADLESAAQKIYAEIQRLGKKHGELEKKKCDIEHYIENYSLNAAEGYRMAKMLQDILRERRDIKNDIQRLNQLKMETVGTLHDDRARSRFDKAQEVMYRPRIMPELFQGKSGVKILL